MKLKNKKPPEWSKNISLYEVNLRQFSNSGTFAEFETHLPRLKELGVGILWFMPIQPIGVRNRKGSLGSYYSIKNYTEVDPAYGTLEEFKQLVQKIHDLGMYVILDWVANHTAWDSNLTVEHPGFYTKDQSGNFTPPFPEWADVIDLNYDNEDLITYMADAMKFWITETNIDGFRCDMAHLVSTYVWETIRPELNKVKDVLMLAESENRDLLEKAFDMEYNWKLFHILNDVAKGNKNVADIDNLLQQEVIDFPEHSYQLFFTSNHDENSWNGSAIERIGVGLEPISIFTFTVHGMPLIYSGQEAGNWKRISFFDKDLIEWKEDKMYRFYSLLNNLKRRNKALWNGIYGGGFLRIKTSADYNVLAYIRKKEEQAVFVVLNLSGTEHDFSLFGNDYVGKYKNIFSKETVELQENSQLVLKPWDYRVYEME